MPLDILISNTKNANNAANPQAANNGSNGGTSGNTATAATKDSAVKQTATSVFVHQVLNTGKAIAKSTAKYMISQYGDMTGDYIGQRKIDNMVSAAEGLISLGTSFTLGAISGGWVGALVGVGLTGIQMGFSTAQSRYETEKRLTSANAQANYNAQRIGSILVDGNRG